MIIDNPSPYLQVVDFDQADEMIIKILDEGTRRVSQFKDKQGNEKIVYDFKVQLPDGRVKIATVKGMKGIGWILANWGKDSSKYVGKTVSAHAIRNQLVAGKKVDYVTIGFNPLNPDAAAGPDEPEDVPPPGGPDGE